LTQQVPNVSTKDLLAVLESFKSVTKDIRGTVTREQFNDVINDLYSKRGDLVWLSDNPYFANADAVDTLFTLMDSNNDGSIGKVLWKLLL